MSNEQAEDVDPETMPLSELVTLVDRMASEIRQRARNVNYLLDPRRATTLEQRIKGRQSREIMMSTKPEEFKKLALILKRRLASEAQQLSEFRRIIK